MNVPFLDLRRQHAPLRDELLAALAETLDDTRFALGRDVEEFEHELATFCGAQDAVGVDNGTSALHLAALSLGLGPDDEILVPPFTFISTAWTATYIGARLRFADISLDTFNLDPAALEAAITPRTRAVVVVHLFGRPADMDCILAVTRPHGIRVIEDAAQAIGALHRGTHVGLLGDAGTFSFYPTKNLGACGEAGAVIARDPAILRHVRLLRVHGSPRRYHHTHVGFNCRMEGFQGAVLRVKLRRLPAWNARRAEIARRYRESIHLADTRLPSEAPGCTHVYHQFTLLHPRRDALREHLAKCGVGTDTIYPEPLHLQPCYAGLGYRQGAFPAAEEAARTCLSLPIFPELTDSEIEHVIRSVNAF